MEKLHFAQFLSDNSFIGVNDNSTIADLLKKKLQNQDAKIIIKKDDDYLIYPHGKALINFLGEQHPDTKIKNVGSLTGLSGNMPWVISGDLPSGTQQFLDGIVDHRAGDAKTFFPNAINGLVSNYFSDGNLVTDKASYNIIDTVNNAGHYDWTDTGEDIKVGNMPQSEPPPEPQSDIKTQPYYLVSEFPETVSQNTVFTLNVFLSRDQLAKASPALLLQDGWQIDILVHARSGVQLTGDSQGVIVVSSKSIDQKIPFALKTLDGDKGIFNVMAIHEGVVLFQSQFEIKIIQEQPANNPVSISKQEVCKPRGDAPDLTLLIFQSIEQSKLTLTYYLTAPDKKLNLNYKKFISPSFQQQDPGAYFFNFFDDIEGIPLNTPQDRLDAVERLKGKGAYLYQQLFPEAFRRLFWQIRNQIKSVIIDSEEPWVPWEICYAYDEDAGINENGFFFCEAYDMSRWIPGSNSPGSELSLQQTAFVIPSDSNLPYPPTERKEIIKILQQCNGNYQDVQPSFKNVIQSFRDGKCSVWHFSGHGTNNDGANPDRYRIVLEDDSGMTPDNITGIKSMGNLRPIIFFNACQVGNAGMSLTGLGGWPQQFINNKVGAFIGAYWSVQDETAGKLAVRFYKYLASGNAIAAALRQARCDMKNEGDPTWLAYSLYADPLAKITVQ